MVEQLHFKNFGPLTDVCWSNLGKINLIIGANDSGKTFLLKALYASLKTLESYRRGQEPRSASEILADKLYWTFQVDRIGELVSKGAEGPLSSQIRLKEAQDFSYSFGKDTTKQISSLENHVDPRTSNSMFLPAKEVLSLHSIVLQSREQDKVFGFDDTYFDLAKALSIAPKKGKNFSEFADSRKKLETILGGRVDFDEASGWQFIKGRLRFPISIAAEGIKKIAILDTLLGNRYLDRGSILLIDEPESALHPAAISQLLDIIVALAEAGLQFFLASHSYFVIKKLHLIALQKDWSVPLLSASQGTWLSEDLKDGMPDNPIVAESIRLYWQEVGCALDAD